MNNEGKKIMNQINEEFIHIINMLKKAESKHAEAMQKFVDRERNRNEAIERIVDGDYEVVDYLIDNSFDGQKFLEIMVNTKGYTYPLLYAKFNGSDKWKPTVTESGLYKRMLQVMEDPKVRLLFVVE
jgi:hypothetical protein